MRIDRLLVYLRFARTRSRACAMVESGHMRRNGVRIAQSSDDIRIGDVLTFVVSDQVRIVEILNLPERRGPPELARSHYRELDRATKSAIAKSDNRE